MKLLTRIEAEKLRAKGHSLNDISRLLDISLSTASRWCQNVKLSSAQREHLDQKRKEAGVRALMPYIEKNRKQKVTDIKNQTLQGSRDIGRTTIRDRYMLGLGLYWGEGYKQGSQEWGFTNSDPLIIKTVMKWMGEFYAVEISRMHARLTINEIYQGQADALMKSWSKEISIPLSQFAKPTFIKGYGKLGKNPKTYRGTLRLKIRNSTSLRRRILASIAAFGNQIS
ncbi:MAG: hypothetical protein JWN90_166 [Parcubacteria group bacterium]|nr:hypothetical protein [Parcubacteria group bacterium]